MGQLNVYITQNMGLDTQPWKWHLLLQNNWYCAWKLSSTSKKTSCIMNSWYQIWGTWPQNCRNLNDSTTGVCGFWEWAVPTDHATCHPLILLVLCICSHCECQANEESNMEWLWSVIAARFSWFSCSSELTVIWLGPSLALASLPQRLKPHLSYDA